MKHPITLLTSAAMFAAAISRTSLFAGRSQTVSLMKVDPQTVATGYRTSRVVGSTVVNETRRDGTDGTMNLVTRLGPPLTRCYRSAASWAWAQSMLWCLSPRSR